MSMANSLELRVPFLDRKMLELAATLPTRYRVDGNVTKVALRGAALRQLPERTANKEAGVPGPPQRLAPAGHLLQYGEDRVYRRHRRPFLRPEGDSEAPGRPPGGRCP